MSINSKVKARVAANKAYESGKIIRKNAVHSVSGYIQKHPKMKYPALGLLAAYLFLFNLVLNAYIQIRLNFKLIIGVLISLTVIFLFARIDFDFLAGKYADAVGADVETVFHWFYLVIFAVSVAFILIFTGKQIEIAYAIWAVCSVMSIILYINGNCLFDLLASVLEMVCSGGVVMLMLLIRRMLG